MSLPQFLAVESNAPLKLRRPLTADHAVPTSYRPAPGLVEALDSAMMLGVPLLLTGEAGTGKTRSAYWLAEQLRAPLLRHDVKSSSSGRDLLYSFDEVARFRDATQALGRPLIEYVQFQALGEAILRAAGEDAVLEDMSGKPLDTGNREISGSLLARAFGEAGEDAEVPTARLLATGRRRIELGKPQHCVVLIDELDKAPRDAPNDLLAEIENMGFAMPELGLGVCAGSDFKPAVILTSNSEKSLPEPFLRRCAFFEIPPPDDTELANIVASVIAELEFGDELVGSAVRLFRQIRSDTRIDKHPGTAELLAWIELLQHREGFSRTTSLVDVLGDEPSRLDASLCALLKSGDDTTHGRATLRRAVSAA